MQRTSRPSALRHFLLRILAFVALAGAGAAALAQSNPADPPGRAGMLTDIEGQVLFARSGEAQWTDAVRNRPITSGDRLRSDADARAELDLGAAVLHIDGGTVVEITALDQLAAQFAVTAGSANAHVRELAAGENFEIDTPQLALRAAEAGDWRVDVDASSGFTRVTVHSGAVTAYGANGGSMRMQAGQQMVFIGRELAPLAGVPAPFSDVFDAWVAQRNRTQDESIAARHLPRGVVGYEELDRYGAWAEDPAYGSVWYPQVTVAGWAPYRYGRWEWIEPWGWTWIDDAPWGFAPFHYGRWAVVGSRWAWVPGPLGPRPVYAPALVGFVGGSHWNLTLASGPGIGWYPLAPGEVWQPYYRASAVYVRNVNRYVVPAQGSAGAHYFQRRPEAVTAMSVNDFHRGAPTGRQWTRVEPSDLARGRPVVPAAPSAQERPGNDRPRPGLRVVASPPARQAPPSGAGSPTQPSVRPIPRQPDATPRQHQQPAYDAQYLHQARQTHESIGRGPQPQVQVQQPQQRPAPPPSTHTQAHQEHGVQDPRPADEEGGPGRGRGRHE